MTWDEREAPPPARLERSGPLAPDTGPPPITTFEMYEPEQQNLRDFLGILQRRRRAVLLSLVAVFGLTTLVTAVTPRVYESTATLLISEVDSRRIDIPGLQSGTAAMGSPNLDTHVQLIQGEATAEETAQWLSHNGGPELSPVEFRKVVSARAVRDTQLIRVSARARSTEEAKAIGEAVSRTYVALNRRRARGSSEMTGRQLAEQLQIAKERLTEAEDELRAFKESSGAIAADAAAGALLSRTASLRGNIDATAADLAQARARTHRVRSELANQNLTIQAGQVRNNAVVQQLRGRLAELQGERLAAEARYTPEFPGPLAQIDEQIRLVREQLEAEIRQVVRGGGGDLELQQRLTGELIQAEAEVAALGARQSQLQAELNRANQELGGIPATQIRLAGLQRQVDVAQGIYSELLRRSQEVEVGRVMALGNADIVEPASTPRLPVRPNIPLNLALGLLLGLGLGLGLAMVQEQLDDTVRNQREASRLAAAPVVGMIPAFEERPAAALTANGPQSAAVEAYRALRYCLDFLARGERGRVVMVTSPCPKEGKSSTALNLARAVALTGRRVILVDSDLRRSGLSRATGCSGRRGLSEVLRGELALKDALTRLEGSGVIYLCAGRELKEATELLDSQEMRDVVVALRDHADLVILDSPPVLAAADALVLAGMSDHVLMVCVAGRSQRSELELARGLLARVGESVSGVVLNKLGDRPGYGSYYGRYGHY